MTNKRKKYDAKYICLSAKTTERTVREEFQSRAFFHSFTSCWRCSNGFCVRSLFDCHKINVAHKNVINKWMRWKRAKIVKSWNTTGDKEIHLNSIALALLSKTHLDCRVRQWRDKLIISRQAFARIRLTEGKKTKHLRIFAVFIFEKKVREFVRVFRINVKAFPFLVDFVLYPPYPAS